MGRHASKQCFLCLGNDIFLLIYDFTVQWQSLANKKPMMHSDFQALLVGALWVREECSPEMPLFRKDSILLACERPTAVFISYVVFFSKVAVIVSLLTYRPVSQVGDANSQPFAW